MRKLLPYSFSVVCPPTDHIERKLNCIHINPLQEDWSLVKFPEDCRWSSAKFYGLG